MSYGDVPVSTLIAGGGGTAAGLYAYGASNHKIMCGSVGYVVGAGLALASPLCGTDYMRKGGIIASRGYGGAARCNVIFPKDATWGLTTDTAIGCLTAVAALAYCDANMGQILSAVGGGLVGSTAIQYAYSPKAKPKK